MEITGDIYLSELTDEVLEHLWSFLEKEPVTKGHVVTFDDGQIVTLRNPKTVNRYKSSMKTLLRRAHMKWKVIPHLPMIEKSREHESDGKTIKPHIQQAITNFLRDSDHNTLTDQYRLQVADLIDLLIETGMRPGEPLRMTWSMVDWEDHSITLTGKITKTRKARYIPLSGKAYEILRQRYKDPANRLEIFPGLNTDQVSRTFKQALEYYGWEDTGLTTYCCRHTAATNLVESGIQTSLVQKILGHSTIITTQRYLNHDKKALKEAMQRFDAQKS